METRRQPVEDRFRLCSRKLHIGDFQQITDYLYMKTKGIETPLFKHHKTPNELAYILYDFYQKGLLYVYELNDYDHMGELAGLLLCGVTELWWIEGKILLEELVVSLTETDCGFGRFAIQVMERKARENGCILICTGSSMVQKTKEVTNLYAKQGYEVYGVSFLKELR